ncbi:MAG: MarR family winged helix-turn-helix transcriptional regulator [Candidatus Dormibacteria bacterium]
MMVSHTERHRAPDGALGPWSAAAVGPYANLGTALELMRRCRRLMSVLERHIHKAAGLGLAECEILVRVAGTAGGPITMSGLAVQSGLTQSGVSRVVDRLEGRSLVECHISANDRRQTLVQVTGPGADLVRGLLGLLEEASHEGLA